MEKAEIIDTLSRMGALSGNLEGPVSELELNADRLIEDPIVTNRIAVEGLHLLPRDTQLEAVICTQESELFAYSTATAAWCRFGCLDEVDGRMQSKHGFAIAPKKKVLIVVNELTDAKQVQLLVEYARTAETEILGVLTLRCTVDSSAIDAPVLAILS